MRVHRQRDLFHADQHRRSYRTIGRFSSANVLRSPSGCFGDCRSEGERPLGVLLVSLRRTQSMILKRIATEKSQLNFLLPDGEEESRYIIDCKLQKVGLTFSKSLASVNRPSSGMLYLPQCCFRTSLKGLCWKWRPSGGARSSVDPGCSRICDRCALISGRSVQSHQCRRPANFGRSIFRHIAAIGRYRSIELEPSSWATRTKP